jgi:iron complex outermembrane recepter protein
MQFNPAPLCALLVTSLSATAQTQPLQPSAPAPSVIVTGNPLGSALFDMVAPVSALESPDLQLRAQGSLGETLGRTPGVHSTYFGPGAGRPIIRGMDGDRIRILQNSIGTLDASGLSYDHAVPIDPISVDRIEVVRGPATLFYGGSAMGGVVNVLTNRIPEKAVMGVQGSVDSRFGGAERERGLGTKLEAGNGRFALHIDGSWRNTADLKIPGFARSTRQRAADAATVDQPNGEVPNTSSQTSGGALGGSFTWDQGFAGLSYTSLSTNYGSPAERNVRLDMHSDRYDASGEVRGLRGLITSVKFKAAYTDYVHREINGGIVSTNFLNKGHEGRIEATHAPIGPIKGAFGVQIGKSRFSALGDEAYVPTSLTETRAVYLFEELTLGTGKLSFGARHERTSIGTAANAVLLDASTGLARFGTEQAKRLGATSASLGAFVPVGPVALTANLARTERAPTQAELFAYGPHAATGTYELGNANFGVEKSNGVDLGVKWRSGAHSASVSAYQTRFTNYMTGFLTGTNRDEDGTINAAGEFRELSYRQTAARFNGFEAEARFRLLERPATLYLELMADSVTATNTATSEPLPRIPSARFGAGLNYATSTWSAKIEGTRSAAQSRVPAGDTATDGYTLWNAYGTYRLSLGNTRTLGWVKLANLTNREARMATSILRERVPLGGRALSVGIKVDF